ncbi:unnamed protein product [Brassica napus]|uniref:(rape) hypothetical protein n=1 Tax=Brassica napus TaxID=3708 RepID=A0A816KJT6_BRANA|nr:unnamed protein product [Brassica napus]
MKNEIEQESLSCGAPCFDDTDGSIQDDTDGSEKIQEKTSSSDPCDGDSSSKKTKRVTIKWTSALENEFFMAIEHIGLHSKYLKF